MQDDLCDTRENIDEVYVVPTLREVFLAPNSPHLHEIVNSWIDSPKGQQNRIVVCSCFLVLTIYLMIVLCFGVMLWQILQLVFGINKIIIGKQHPHIKHVEKAADGVPSSGIAPPFEFDHLLD